MVENVMSLYSVQHFVNGRKRHVPIYHSDSFNDRKRHVSVMFLYTIQQFANDRKRHAHTCIYNSTFCSY